VCCSSAGSGTRAHLPSDLDHCVLPVGLQGSADASVAALRSASTSSMAMDDAGLDGFVHMHMIDDLLTE
jgi:hypothetical protein